MIASDIGNSHTHTRKIRVSNVIWSTLDRCMMKDETKTKIHIPFNINYKKS